MFVVVLMVTIYYDDQQTIYDGTPNMREGTPLSMQQNAAHQHFIYADLGRGIIIKSMAKHPNWANKVREVSN